MVLAAHWLPLSGIHRVKLAVGTSSESVHMLPESKKAQRLTKKHKPLHEPMVTELQNTYWCEIFDNAVSKCQLYCMFQ